MEGRDTRRRRSAKEKQARNTVNIHKRNRYNIVISIK